MKTSAEAIDVIEQLIAGRKAAESRANWDLSEQMEKARRELLPVAALLCLEEKRKVAADGQ